MTTSKESSTDYYPGVVQELIGQIEAWADLLRDDVANMDMAGARKRLMWIEQDCIDLKAHVRREIQ